MQPAFHFEKALYMPHHYNKLRIEPSAFDMDDLLRYHVDGCLNTDLLARLLGQQIPHHEHYEASHEDFHV
jgi:hypothetical protein